MRAVESDVVRHVLDEDNGIHKLVIMLAHACDDRPVQGNTKIQKLAFMLSDVDDNADEMGFYKDMYGPYSDIVEEEMRYLNDLGVLSIDSAQMRLTDAGKAVAKRLADEDPDAFETVARYKEMFNDMSTDELLTYVYLSYPSMTEHSQAYDKLKPHMEKHVMSMLRKAKISSGRAAELLGKSLECVLAEAAKNGIRSWDFEA